MIIDAEVFIEAPVEAVWKVICDIDLAAERISGIDEIEILERPEGDGLVGLKWRETRTLFGKTATEVMWITAATENEFYRTRAESHGAIYRSGLTVTEHKGGTLLRMDFKGEAQTFAAKLMSFTMGFLFKGATRKAIVQDLEDIKAAVETPS